MSVHGLYNILRNGFCWLLAVCIIASGRVRRGKEIALSKGAVTAIYFHNPNRRLFTRCVTWLRHNGYTFISEQELVRILREGQEPPRGAVWLSFDDGFNELLRNVFPETRKHKIPVTLFLPSAIISGRGLFPWLHPGIGRQGPDAIATAGFIARDSITAADVVEIVKYPEVSIGSHTCGHIVTTGFTEEQTRFEFRESKRMLESWTGRTVTTFAYPEGRFSGREARLLAECGYLVAATTDPGFVTRESDPYLTPRFHVGDNISFPEAICNMTGAWRPAIDPLIRIHRPLRNSISRCWRLLQRRLRFSSLDSNLTQ
jgi:peptidoglycan/xylan/chitin deacetylase (PgdA/CDA1 family)